jgi:tetratricopeptide (TPR) repeat protein
MTQISVDRAMQIAADQRRAGRFADAENIFRQIVAQFPTHPGVIHELAVTLAQQRKLEESLQLLQRVVQLAPSSAGAHSDLGNVLRDMNRLDDAIASYHRAIAIAPDFAIAHSNLGNALRDSNRAEEAAASYRRAIELMPNVADAHSNLGNALSDLGRLEDAIASYRRAIQLAPGFAAAYSNCGAVLQRLGRTDGAIAAFRKAIELAPEYAEAYNNLGHSLEMKNQLDEAMAAYVKAIQLKPDLAGAYCNLGNVLLAKKRVDDAIAAFRTAIRLEPNMPEGHSNLGNALSDQGEFDEAMAEYRLALRLRPKYPDALSNAASALIERGMFDEPEQLLRQAIEIDPKFADAHWNLALLLLLKGDFARGLPEYEWRWQVRNMPRLPSISQPQWTGGDITGKTVLLHFEQGFGDAIQFIRYAPLLAERGAKVIVSAPPELRRLFAGVDGVERIVMPSDPVPPFDLHCPLLSLPLAFKTDLNSIPVPKMPYVHAGPGDVEKWRDRLSGEKRRRIGLAWAGDPRHKRDATRTIVLCNFAPFSELNDAAFYSLQKGEGAKHLPPVGVTINDHTTELYDFADTAAFIANLDLVIAVDTSIVHLAGAMGKPVWILVQYSPDWRWLLDRDDSPWYPTMRLFRQKKYGDWTEVIRRVTDELKAGAR